MPSKLSSSQIFAMLALLGLVVLAIEPQSTHAAVTTAWVQRYNSPGNGDDIPAAVATDRSGNVVVSGGSGTFKYAAADGTVLWEEHRLGGSGPIAVDSSGNVVVTGYYIAKFAAADGALLWEHPFAGFSSVRDDRATALALDSSGNVVVTGYSANPDNIDFDDFYTAKYAAADGTLLWVHRYNGPANDDDAARGLVMDSSGNVVVTGTSYTRNGDITNYTAKYAAADGTLLWENYGLKYAGVLAVDGSDNLIVSGGNDTAKYAAADGALLWKKPYNATTNGTGSAWAVAADGSGNVVVFGKSYDGTNSDFYTAKYAASDGALLWDKHYDGPANSDDYPSYPSALAVEGSGNVVVTGYSYNGANYDFYTAKYAAANGALFWEERYNASTDPWFFFLYTLALGPDGVVAVTGSSHGITGFDYVTVAYREPDARAPKENVLAELIALRATVTERNDGRRLDEAVRHLTNSLAARFWTDETHLDHKHGVRVFHEDMLAVWNLCRLLKSRTNQIPDAVIQGFIDRIFQADRLLADDAIGDAITAGVSSNRIKQAQKLLARGDAATRDNNCSNGLAAYSNAWMLAVRAKVPPAVSPSTRTDAMP